MKLRTLQISFFFLFALITAGGAQAQDWVYEAQPGDSLWDICLEYTSKRGCWQELSEYNGIAKGQSIEPGSEIRIPVHWLVALPVVGEVLHVAGEVRYQEQDGSNPIPLVKGEQLMLGSVITTVGGTAKIALGDYSEIFIRPNSVLELTDIGVGSNAAKVTRLRLDKGNVEIRVTPGSRSRFEVHTPSAIAAVRGTRYRVSADMRESTRSEVLSGLVVIQAEAEKDVPAGFGLLAAKGEPLGSPRKLLDPPAFASSEIAASLPIRLRWESDPLAAQWHLDLYLESGAFLSSTQTTKPEAVYEALEPGCYQLIARAIDADGFNGLESDVSLCVVEPEEDTESFLDVILWVIFAIGVMI
ncbi:MAG: FecR domain-containing protein [Halioglobus sp.]